MGWEGSLFGRTLDLDFGFAWIFLVDVFYFVEKKKVKIWKKVYFVGFEMSRNPCVIYVCISCIGVIRCDIFFSNQ